MSTLPPPGKNTADAHVNSTLLNSTRETKKSAMAPFYLPSWIGTQAVVGLLDIVLVYVFMRLLQVKMNGYLLEKKRK